MCFKAWLVLLWMLAIVLGAIDMWASRFWVDPDIISYLNMADAYQRGDWSMALNGCWNPLYAFLIVLMRLVFDPDPYVGFEAFHLLNFAIYLGGLLCVHFVARQLVRFLENRATVEGDDEKSPIPEWALFGLAYCLYIWTSLDLVSFEQGADLTMATLLYLAFGLLLRIANEPERTSSSVLLGVVLAFAYLTKAIMMPLSVVFIGVAALLGWKRPGLIRRLALMVATFALVSAPFITALSISRGRLTYSDTGGFNYALHVSAHFGNTWLPPYFHWQGEVPGLGKPEHPTRQIFEHPAVYEFATPFNATYGAWYDPSYWYAGMTSHFDLRNQFATIRHTTRKILGFAVGEQPALLAGLLALLWISIQSRRTVRGHLRLWMLLLPAAAGVGLYTLIHVESRFIGAYVGVGWLALFAGIPFARDRSARLVTSGIIIGVVATVFVAGLFAEAKENLVNIVRHERGADNEPVRVARKLRDLGLKPGAKVANIGFTFYANWARLARVRIVAEITTKDAPDYWSADLATKAQVRETMAKYGVVAIISETPPENDPDAHWQPVDANGKYFVSFLQPPGPTPARDRTSEDGQG